MNPLEWDYHSEGGANLLVSYQGSLSQFQGKLLRIRKSKINQLGRGSMESAAESVEFQREIISKLLEEEWIVKMVELRVESTFLTGLKDRIKMLDIRPYSRSQVDEIDVTQKSVVVLDDLLAEKGTLTVEIKPKWGFLPCSKFLSPATSQIKLQRCRFCRHRDYRRRGGAKAIDMVEYCPLNLFSKDQKRVEKGVEGLWNGWIESKGQGNNLRIALDGAWLDPTQLDSLNRISNFFQSSSPSLTLQQALSGFLFSSPFLSKLRFLQSSFDPIDIEGLALLHRQGTGESLEIFKTFDQPLLDEWIQWLHRWTTRGSDDVTGSTATESTAMDLVMAYLLSASFKDCSLLIRIRYNSVHELQMDLKVIDLDSKSIRKVASYEQLDKDLFCSKMEKVA